MNSYIQLYMHPDYEIMTTYPHKIRRIRDKRIINENITKYGYVRIKLNLKDYLKHKIIAEQFIPNPKNLSQVDHINKNRADYHIENLRWVSSSDNCKNKSAHKGVKYEFIDDIPNDAIEITYYDTRTEHRIFDEGKLFYYFNEIERKDIFYYRITDNIYKILHINKTKSGGEYVNANDINNKQTAICLKRFKYEYDL